MSINSIDEIFSEVDSTHLPEEKTSESIKDYKNDTSEIIRSNSSEKPKVRLLKPRQPKKKIESRKKPNKRRRNTLKRKMIMKIIPTLIVIRVNQEINVNLMRPNQKSLSETKVHLKVQKGKEMRRRKRQIELKEGQSYMMNVRNLSIVKKTTSVLMILKMMKSRR